jgi:hypothetical protein
MTTLNVLTTRLSESDLPATCLIQYGEMYWDDDVNITWITRPEFANLTWEYSDWHKSYVISTGSGHGFAGWDEDNSCYMRYGAGSEHCFRIFKKLASKLTQQQLNTANGCLNK